MKLIMSSGIYEMFCNHKNFYIGKQPEPFPGTDTVRWTVLPKTVDVASYFLSGSLSFIAGFYIHQACMLYWGACVNCKRWACFSFHVGLFFIPFSSFKPYTENNADFDQSSGDAWPFYLVLLRWWLITTDEVAVIWQGLERQDQGPDLQRILWIS